MKKAYNIKIVNLKTGEIVKDFNEISHTKKFLQQKYRPYKFGFPKCDVLINKYSKNKEFIQLEIF